MGNEQSALIQSMPEAGLRLSTLCRYQAETGMSKLPVEIPSWSGSLTVKTVGKIEHPSLKDSKSGYHRALIACLCLNDSFVKKDNKVVVLFERSP